METPLWLTLTIACTPACAAAAAGSHWWFRCQLAALDRKLAKFDKAREFAVQQSMQARKQVERLQVDLLTQQRNLSRAQVTRQRADPLVILLNAADPKAANGGLPPRPAHGFADTRPLASADAA